MKDTREPRISEWRWDAAMYPVRSDALPKGVHMEVGTVYPRRPEAKTEAVEVIVRLKLSDRLEPRAVRRALHAGYRAALAQVDENKAWAGVAELGGQDQPSVLPVTRPPQKMDIFVFWGWMLDAPRPVLMFRSLPHAKHAIKAALEYAWVNSGKEGQVKKGWWKEGRVWWCFTENGYPHLLGHLRLLGFRLVWVQRARFPPPPPIEDLSVHDIAPKEKPALTHCPKCRTTFVQGEVQNERGEEGA